VGGGGGGGGGELGVLELYTVCEAIFPGSKVTRHKAALKRPNVIDAEENSIRGSYDSSLSTQQQQHATVNTHQQLQHLQHRYSVYSSAATASSTSLQCILNFCIFNIPKRNSHQPLPSASLSKQSHLHHHGSVYSSTAAQQLHFKLNYLYDNYLILIFDFLDQKS
jgi:hypothetical protein